MAQVKKPCKLLICKAFGIGGVDGTRTRDPRRDRPMAEVSICAGLRSIRYSKILDIDAAFSRVARVLFQTLALVSVCLLTACGGGDPEPEEPDVRPPVNCNATPRPAICL